MRRVIFAALLAATASAALAAPTPKDQLLVPPGDAAHYVVVSTAGKHGDEYMWTMPDGRLAIRESILLRGLDLRDRRDAPGGRRRHAVRHRRFAA